MFEAQTKTRVRYAETDQMGYVYYGNYATYYEIGRVETLRQLGFSYNEMEKNGVMMPVVNLQTNYLLPGRYDELLTIKVRIPASPKAKIIFEYEIFNEADQLINKGETTLVFINMKTNKPCRAPEQLMKFLKPYFA
ncbi:acyl-CoA thioesterase [Reichenbachiella carrageenanivorans]|uniref:Acyl-CoA thioesterase n=1 Tax=Reichenbachiella carrageenanivorans TaxID=2979869 RepID=A0ABY6D176_9BACT|nr:thioesterase family protein [Reichenbachiella carrageenanivorans]UXX79459.1 acyl-CoA thioesterase [Reichenbachiella carrageenanivorans]